MLKITDNNLSYIRGFEDALDVVSEALSPEGLSESQKDKIKSLIATIKEIKLQKLQERLML